MEPSLTTLIGDKIRGDHKWSAFVDGGDGFFYGIPCNARRVVKFNPLDKLLTEIGPDFGEGRMKWMCGWKISICIVMVRVKEDPTVVGKLEYGTGSKSRVNTVLCTRHELFGGWVVEF